MSLRDILHLIIPASIGALSGLRIRPGSDENKEIKVSVEKVKDKWGLVFGSLALVISVLSMFWTYQEYERNLTQDETINEINYAQLALAHQPRWEVTQSIHQTNFQPVNEDIDEVIYEIDVTSEITFKNSGNSLGRLVALMTKDVQSGEANLRRILHDPDSEGTTLVTQEYEGYFPYVELSPGQTKTIPFNTKVRYAHNGWGSLHFLVIYENQAGVFFDTYLWIKYQSKSPVYYRKDQPIQEETLLRELFSFVDKNSSSIYYSHDEKERILDIMRKNTMRNDK